MNILCKIFQFILNIFEQILNVIVTALVMLGTAIVDVLGDLAGAVGDALGISGGPVLWIALGGLAFWFFTKDDEDDVKPVSNKARV